MEDFIQNILKINKTIIPKLVVNRFVAVFPSAINIEWYLNGEIYEAVFHENDLEKLVYLDKTGTIIEVKVNLLLSLIPASISEIAAKHGELMNAIEIKSDESVTYEIIVRDKDLVRSLIEIDESGIILNKKLL